MLDINKISHLDAYAEDWRRERLGKFTASEIGKLISESSHLGKFTAGAITYIEGVAGEILTGTPAKAEFFNSNVDYGNAMEAESVSHFCEANGKNVLRDTHRNDTHRLIINDEFTACTPDALVCLSDLDHLFDETGTKLKVAPFETKCPPILHRFIKLYKCETPLDLKKTESTYYYQSLSQLMFCDSLIGYFAPYHPLFPKKQKVITFKKSELIEDIKKVSLTIEYAKKEVTKILSLFK